MGGTGAVGESAGGRLRAAVGSATLQAMRAAVLIFVLMAGFVASAAAEPFEDGLLAYGKGDYATALKHWRPLA